MSKYQTEFTLTSNVDKAIREMGKEGKERLESAAIEVYNETQRKFSGPKTGRWYTKPSGGRYQASAPGEPPARPTGRGAASVKWVGPRHYGGAMKAAVGTTAEHMAKLETGIYPAGPKSEVRRPWLRPSFNDADVKKILGGKKWRI